MTPPPSRGPICLGSQTFDGLGRPLSVTHGGRTSSYHYDPGRLPPSAQTLADASSIGFAYVAALDNQITRIEPANEPARTFSYDPALGLLASASGALGRQTLHYQPSGKPARDTWSIDGAEHVTRWHYSLAGLLLGFEDASSTAHKRHYDAHGRLQRIEVGAVSCVISYDAFSRPHTYTTRDTGSGNQLVQQLGYDALGRENLRMFSATLDGKIRRQQQALTYNDLDQVVARHWQDDEREGSERFVYDLLGRLIRYSADPAVAPEDPFGNRVAEQRFTLNALDGYEKVLTTFVDGSRDEAEYHYSNPQDPCQVSAISHTHSSWPARIELHYDARGRLQSDSLGRRLSWDAQDRVTRVEYRGQVCEYAYDPSGNLCDRRVDGGLSRSFHSAGQLTHEQRGDEVMHLAADAGQLFALTRLRAGVRQGTTTLLGCDAQGSVRVEADHSLRSRRYTAHGAEPAAASPADNPFAYTGERREPLSGWYIPAGYRPYDPLLMIFLAPDSESPFGRGGLNAYAYCGGDPVNRIDPDGHSWWSWLVAGIGLVLGAVATVASFGAAAPAFAALAAGGIGALTASGAASITAATLGAVSLGTGIASTVLEAVDKDSKAAGILGWVSLGTGLAGTALEIAPKAASAAAAKASRLAGRGTSKSASKAKALPGSLRRPAPDQAKDVIFFPDYDGSKTPAFITHGAPDGTLLSRNHGWLPADELARLEIKPDLDLFTEAGLTKPDSHLLLIACRACDSGAAQQVANVIRRPTIAPFGRTIVEDFTGSVQSMLKGSGHGRVFSETATLPSHLKPRVGSAGRVDAIWNIYLPQ